MVSLYSSLAVTASTAALASSTDFSTATTQPSRSALLEASKECLWLWTLKEKMTLPSLATSVASAWKMVSKEMGEAGLAMETHQLQDALRGSLLVGVLGEEKQALAGLAGPGDSGVGVLALLAAKVAGEALLGDGGLLAEPEVLLGEGKAPAMRMLAQHVPRQKWRVGVLLDQAGSLVAESTGVDGLSGDLDLALIGLLLGGEGGGLLGGGRRSSLLGGGRLGGSSGSLSGSGLVDGGDVSDDRSLDDGRVGSDDGLRGGDGVNRLCVRHGDGGVVFGGCGIRDCGSWKVRRGEGASRGLEKDKGIKGISEKQSTSQARRPK